MGLSVVTSSQLVPQIRGYPFKKVWISNFVILKQIVHHSNGLEKLSRMKLFPPLQLHSQAFYKASKVAKATTSQYRIHSNFLQRGRQQKLKTFSDLTFHALSNETTPVSQLDYES